MVIKKSQETAKRELCTPVQRKDKYPSPVNRYALTALLVAEKKCSAQSSFHFLPSHKHLPK